MAVVVEICGLRGRRKQNKTKKEIKTLTATTQEYLLGQGAVRAVWILSAMKARGAAGGAASTFIQPLALEGVASRLDSRLKEEVQWASSTLARKKNWGRHYASSHIYSLTHTRVHTHFILCKTTNG